MRVAPEVVEMKYGLAVINGVSSEAGLKKNRLFAVKHMRRWNHGAPELVWMRKVSEYPRMKQVVAVRNV